MSLWDFKVKTNDPERGSVGVVEAPSKKQAREEIIKQVHAHHPDLTIHKITLRPSIGVANMNNLMQANGITRVK